MARTTLAPAVRSVRTRRVNRFALTVLALLLTAAGAGVLVLGLGLLGTAQTSRPVLSESTVAYADHHDWYWFVVGNAAVIVALLAFWWLYVQLRSSDAAGTLHLESDETGGASVLSPSALESAVAEEARSYLGVSGARARLTGDSVPLGLLVVAELDGRAPVADLRDRLEDGPVAHARQALENPDLPVRLELHLAPRKPGSTRRHPRTLSDSSVTEAAERDATGIDALQPDDPTLPHLPSAGAGLLVGPADAVAASARGGAAD